MGFGGQMVQRNVKQQELEFRNKLMSLESNQGQEEEEEEKMIRNVVS
jgi:hypothetical protein